VYEFARSIYLQSSRGVPTQLHAAGTTLENPYVYDSVARDLKQFAQQGLLEIVTEELRSDSTEPLIASIAFRRLR